MAARTEAKLDTRNARRALPHRAKPYFRLARRGAFPVHLGYYRGKDRPGTWIGRRYLGGKEYETAALGTADDDPRLPADGVAVLDFDQAQRAVISWADGKMQAARAAVAAEGSPTVRAAVEAYITSRKARQARAGRDAELRLGHHVLKSPLADLLLLALTDADLAKWRKAIGRGGRGRAAESITPLASSTIARLLNDLRAALTASARAAKAPADLHTTIRDGLRAPERSGRARAKQVLPDGDVRKLVEAAAAHDADFGALVLVLASTGARFDQAARLTVGDFQPRARRLMIPVSHKGKGEKQITHIAVPVPDDVVARLKPLATGRAGHEPLLTRWHHRQVAGDKEAGVLPGWERDRRRAWSVSAEIARPWHATVEAAHLSPSLIPYCLRHSSIVRGLRAGLPVRLVAAAHDTSVAMIEKHYGAFIVDATEDLLRRAMVPMAGVEVMVVTKVPAKGD